MYFDNRAPLGEATAWVSVAVGGHIPGGLHGRLFRGGPNPRETLFRLPVGDTASEPVFVARGEAEGDGWLLVAQFRQNSLASELVVLDAAELAAGPLARALLPCRVPAGVHCNRVGDAS